MWRIALVFSVLFDICACADPPWWGNVVYYRLLVDSFRDGDGDGLGDLIGATKQLSYVRALGADAVILSPIMMRSSDCSKPGPVDFTDLDARYGTIQDLTNFMEKAKKLELKVLMTLPLQTVSSQSQWFIDSADNKRGFEDWIVWNKGDGDAKPQNQGIIDDWVYQDTRSEFFAASNNESVLNLCSDGVAAALSSAQCSWLRRGMHGVLLNPDFLDLKCSEKLVQKMTAEAMSCARANSLETPVILVQSSESPDISSKYLSNGGVGANGVISNALSSSERKSAAELMMAFHAAITYTSEDATTAWITTASDKSHVSNRYGNDMVDVINLLNLILPGSAIIQQGDELGTADTISDWVSHKDICWPNRQLPSSAPFSWDSSATAGFSTGEPWLPLATNYRYANAKTQFNYEGSHAGVVRTAAAMRKSPAIGPHVEMKRLGEVLAILRWGGTGSLLLVCNVGHNQAEVQISKLPGLPPEMIVATSSAGSRYAPANHVNLEKMLKLASGEAILLAGPPRHCGGPGPVDKITTKLQEGWQKINKYFGN